MSNDTALLPTWAEWCLFAICAPVLVLLMLAVFSGLLGVVVALACVYCVTRLAEIWSARSP